MATYIVVNTHLLPMSPNSLNMLIGSIFSPMFKVPLLVRIRDVAEEHWNFSNILLASYTKRTGRISATAALNTVYLAFLIPTLLRTVYLAISLYNA